MELQIETNAPEVARGLTTVFRDQIPFAVALGTNALANRVQQAQREHQAEIFTLRRKSWADRAVKRRYGTDFATRDNPTAIVRYDAPGGREDILTKFETEDEKRPRVGSSIAVPTEEVPRTASGIIRKGWRPRNLELERRGGGVRGKRRTFVLHPTPQLGMILAASGRGEERTTRVLYWLVPEVDLPPELDFEDNAATVVRDHAADEFRAAFDRAVATARI